MAGDVQSFYELRLYCIPFVGARVGTDCDAQVGGIDHYNAKGHFADRLNSPLWIVKANSLDWEKKPSVAPRLDTAALETQLHYQVVGNGAARILYLPGMADMQPGGEDRLHARRHLLARRIRHPILPRPHPTAPGSGAPVPAPSGIPRTRPPGAPGTAGRAARR